MAVRVNFAGSEGSGFSVIPDGDYDGVVFDGEMKDGNEFPYINWTLKVTEGEGEEGSFFDRRLWHNTSLSPKAIWRLKKMLENLGVEIETDEEGNFDLEIDDIKGLPCVIRIGHEEYQGQTRNKVKDILPAGTKKGGGKKGMFGR